MDGTMNKIKRSMSSQSGFTLIELLAVMAIIAVLVAIVAPAVSGTKNSSSEAQAIQDALQVRTAATSYFQDQNSTEILTNPSGTTTPLVVKVGSLSEAYTDGSNTATTTITGTQQKSSRWPEKFITSTATSTDSVYYVEFPITTSNDIDTVYVVDDGKAPTDDNLIGQADLFSKYTAIDIAALVTGKYLEDSPDSGDLTVTLGTTKVHTLVWLFRKTTSAGSAISNDSREVTVFKLESATKGATKYTLVYRQIF